MTRIADTVTYLEMFERPPPRPRPPPSGKLALMRAEECTVSFYRYLYETVGTPWLWYERRLMSDAALGAELAKPTTEIFVLYVAGVPAGYFELDAADPRETELCYFGLIPEFVGRRLGPFLLNAAIERACASSPSASASAMASGPSNAIAAGGSDNSVVRFMKSSTERPEEKRAVREVGSTWLGPAM